MPYTACRLWTPVIAWQALAVCCSPQAFPRSCAQLNSGPQTSPGLVGEKIQLSCLILQWCMLEGGWLAWGFSKELVI